jgi:hypothetical protein
MERRCYAETWAFYQYWSRKRARPDGSMRVMPSRRDIDPIEMKRWLPYLQLIDVFYDAGIPVTRRLVYRLVGEAEVTVRGYNPTGRLVSDAAIGKDLADPMGNYNIVIDERRPLYDWSKIPHPSGFLVSQECVLLPLSDDDDVVNMVITFGRVVSSVDPRPTTR